MSWLVAWQVESFMKTEKQVQILLLKVDPRFTFCNKFPQLATNAFVARQVDHARWKAGNIDQKRATKQCCAASWGFFVSRISPPKGKIQDARVQFPRRNSPNFRADLSGRTKRFWSMSRVILARTSSENSCVPFKKWLVGPTRPDEWKTTLIKIKLYARIES